MKAYGGTIAEEPYRKLLIDILNDVLASAQQGTAGGFSQVLEEKMFDDFMVLYIRMTCRIERRSKLISFFT